MEPGVWTNLITHLIKRGIAFDKGLSSAEMAHVEEQFQFRFPPDLCEFLQAGLPCGEGFPNWRAAKESALQEWMDLPREGLLFDVEHNNFWLPEWGTRPDSLREAMKSADELIARAPRLIPIYRHRMLPDEPHLPGNPVFSVHQTDIIYYGFDLDDYLRHEFRIKGRRPWPKEPRLIRFWDIDQFQAVRWSGGSCLFDNRRGHLP